MSEGREVQRGSRLSGPLNDGLRRKVVLSTGRSRCSQAPFDRQTFFVPGQADRCREPSKGQH